MKIVLMLTALMSFSLIANEDLKEFKIVIEDYKIEVPNNYSHDLGDNSFDLEVVVATEEAANKFVKGEEEDYQYVKLFGGKSEGYDQVLMEDRSEETEPIINVDSGGVYADPKPRVYSMEKVLNSQRYIKRKIAKNKEKGEASPDQDEEAKFLFIASTDMDNPLFIYPRWEVLKGVKIPLSDLKPGKTLKFEYTIPSKYKVGGSKSEAKVSFKMRLDSEEDLKQLIATIEDKSELDPGSDLVSGDSIRISRSPAYLDNIEEAESDEEQRDLSANR